MDQIVLNLMTENTRGKLLSSLWNHYMKFTYLKNPITFYSVSLYQTRKRSMFIFNKENALTTMWRNYPINPFHATSLFLYPLKTSENQRLSDIFRGKLKETSGMWRVAITPKWCHNNPWWSFKLLTIFAIKLRHRCLTGS